MLKSNTEIDMEPVGRTDLMGLFVFLALLVGGLALILYEPDMTAVGFGVVFVIGGVCLGIISGGVAAFVGWVLVGGYRSILVWCGTGVLRVFACLTGIVLLVGTLNYLFVVTVLFICWLLVLGWRPTFPYFGTVKLSGVLVTGWVVGGGIGGTFGIAGSGFEDVFFMAVSGAVLLVAVGMFTQVVEWCQNRVIVTTWWTSENVMSWVGTGLVIGVFVFNLIVIPFSLVLL